MYFQSGVGMRNFRGIRLGQGVKKLLSQKLIEATEKVKKAQKDLSKADVSKAVDIVKSKVIKSSMKLGAGETIVVDGQLPIDVVNGLTAINVDTTVLSEIQSKWILTLNLPELYFEQLFSLEAFKNGMAVNLPNVNMPDVSRLDVNEDTFRNNVAEWQGGITQRWVASDVRIKDTLAQVKALVTWARNIKPNNVYLIIDGELGKLKDNLNSRVGQAVMGVKKLVEDVLKFVVKPRDAMLSSLIGAMKESFNTMREAIDFQQKAIDEISGLYTGIANTAQAVTGQPVSEGDDPMALLNKVRDTATQNRELLDTELVRLQNALNEITKSLGV